MKKILSIAAAALALSACTDETGASKGAVNQSIADHAAQPAAHHAKTISATELTTGTLDPARLPSTMVANDYTYGTPKTSSVRVSFGSFVSRAGYGVTGLQRGFVYSTLASPSEAFSSVDGLPVGATITRFACTMKVPLAGGVAHAFLTRYALDGNEVYLADVQSGITAAYAEVADTTIIDPVVAAGDDFVIGAVLNGAGQTSVQDANLKGCVVNYTTTSLTQ